MARSVLFVDDSEVARITAQRRLGELGIGVTVLGSSREAAEVDASSFFAALLDLELGDGLGTEIAQRLRQDAPRMPIAFLSAAASSAVVDVAQTLGPVFSKLGGVDDAISWVAEAARRARD
jgi:CheY-like chemotaxis protein